MKWLLKTHQHVDVMHQVKAEEGELHNEVSIVDIGAFALPSAFMVQIPQVNRVPTKSNSKASALYFAACSETWELNSSSFTAYKWHMLILDTEDRRNAYLVITCPVRTVTSKHWGWRKRLYLLTKGINFLSTDVKKYRNQKFLTSAAIKATVCMPWRWPTRPQSTARPPQHSSMDTSRASTRTWLLMGVVGEKDS